MYRWTDPIDPDDASRRPEQPTDQGPAWLTDRPEPRSSYLFGDEPAQPPAGHLPPTLDAGRYGDVDGPGPGPAGYGPAMPQPGYPAEQPGYATEQPGYAAERTGHLAAQPGYAAAPDHGHGAAETGYDPHAPFAPAGPYPHAPFAAAGPHPTDRDRWNGEEQRDRWNGEEQPAGAWAQPTAAWQPVTDTPPDDSRHRQKRRFSRPLVIGGAAAVATLVVSLGVGAVLLPGGDGPAERTAADAPALVAPDGPEQTDSAPPADALVPGSASPSATPTTVKPSPTKKATPRPSRTKAPSRQLERSSAPSGTTARTTSSGGLSSELQQVVTLVNQERAKAGCKALTVNSKLTLAAQRHSQDQADHKKMSHDGSDGSKFTDRYNRVGYAFRSGAENVAWGYESADAVMKGWMNSEGHRNNILNCSYTEIGVGVARSNGPYWTQDFGTPR
ncbi:CAP domain-containing protein [Micromonospora robiginosa]|uniref:CAP domain-containing protein n=1 Tax=Micromonospora robiginosa TaxID=2749844 RepID=A0A7L6BEG6_9ACTN|nr:CAP domain-containing protein [Micromonospora ferruginea]QLQ40329.2 CAP domain-containing protein [Micromonospora ferruginea]